MNMVYPSLGLVFTVIGLFYLLLNSHKNVLLVVISLVVTNIGLLTANSIQYINIVLFVFVCIVELVSFFHIWDNQEVRNDAAYIAIAQIVVFLMYIFS